MPDNSRLNSSQEQSTIEKLRASYLPQMPFSAKNNTAVQFNGEVEKSQETFKAELNNISSLIQTLEKNPQDLELRAQISTRLTNAVSTAAASIPLADCERMMQNYGIRTYWEDMKAGKTTLTDQNKDLNQAQLHQEQQAVLTAQQIAQIKQQAINDYNKTWKDHNNFDYIHASAADREKWMQDELKKMPQWAQELGQIAGTKPFNEAKIELQEQARQKLKDIEEKKKEMLAIINNRNAPEEERKQASRHLQLYLQEQQNVEKFQQGVNNAKTSRELCTECDALREASNQTGKIATQSLTHQSKEETSENNRTANGKKTRATSFNEDKTELHAETTHLREASNQTGKIATQSLAHQSKEEISENNRTANRKKTQAISLSAVFNNTHFRDESRTTLSSDTTAAQELQNVADKLNETSNATSRPDAQNMGTLLSALNSDTLQEGENKNIVMSSTAEKENTPNTSDKPKEISLAAVLKDMNTPQAPDISNQTTSEQQAAQTTSTVSTKPATELSDLNLPPLAVLPIPNSTPKTPVVSSNDNTKVSAPVVSSNGNTKVSAPVVSSNGNTKVSVSAVETAPTLPSSPSLSAALAQAELKPLSGLKMEQNTMC